MAEVLVEFDSEFKGSDGKVYDVRACGRERPDKLWEGWLEFVPRDGSAPRQTGRETTQPNRNDVVYWATGLTTTYIDGALDRVLTPPPAIRVRATSSQPSFEGPAEHAVLDPFHVYREGDHVLRGQLNALNDGQLRTIIRDFGITDTATADAATRDELISIIMTAAQKRAA